MKRKILRSTLLTVLAIVMIFTLVGCQSAKTTTGEGESQDSGQLVVGFASSGLNHPFQISLKDGIVQEAKAENIKVVVVDAQDDAAKQISSIEDLIQQKVDLIIINPVDSDAVGAAIDKANQAGIPIITVDRGTNTGEVITHIASDNVAGGKLAAEFIAEQLDKKGKIIEVQGQPGASAARDRGQGLHEGLSSYKDIEIVYSQPADWDRNKAMNVMENALQSHNDIVAVFAHNDEMALGAARAVESANLKDQIIVVGFDAIDEAIEAVKMGQLAATVEQQPVEMGKIAIQKAKEYLNGNTDLPKFIPVDLKLVK